VKKIHKPWGHEEVWAHTNKYAGKILHINKGERLSLQFHEKKEETIYVLEGELLFICGNSEDSLKKIILNQGESMHIEPGLIHRFCATESSVKLIEVSTSELDDVVRLGDDYGRERIKNQNV